MRPILLILSFQLFTIHIFAQNNPPFEHPRAMAEWEELQAIIVVWQYETTGVLDIMLQIVAAAKEECEVIIVTEDTEETAIELVNAGIDTTENIRLIESAANTMWVRDYGPNTVYANDVDTLGIVDWIYNRPDRTLDDVVPKVIANELNVPVFSLEHCPERVVHTGGNFMSDGLGTAFSTKLVLEDNSITSTSTTCPLSTADLDSYMNKYMGIDTYIKVEELFWDEIHHIDMHMKLLDEKTLLVGQYPEGVADGPQIESNLQYILSNFTTAAGEPFEVIRIEMPPGWTNNYIDDSFNPAPNRTYTNALFVNNSILVPTYQPLYDEPALAIWEEAMPGYNIVGINCNDIIGSNGAIHCITKEVGVDQPLWISTNRVVEACAGNIDIIASIKHVSGISTATLYYKSELSASYQSVEMNTIDDDEWLGTISSTAEGKVYYYLEATAGNGKTITRPIPAPDGYFTIDVNCADPIVCENLETKLESVFPNPASAITCIPLTSNVHSDIEIELLDILGRTITQIYKGTNPIGETKYFFNAQNYPSGIYLVQLKSANNLQSQKVLIDN